MTLHDYLVNKYGILEDEAREICKTFLVFGLYPLPTKVQRIIREYATIEILKDFIQGVSKDDFN